MVIIKKRAEGAARTRAAPEAWAPGQGGQGGGPGHAGTCYSRVLIRFTTYTSSSCSSSVTRSSRSSSVIRAIVFFCLHVQLVVSSHEFSTNAPLFAVRLFVRLFVS